MLSVVPGGKSATLCRSRGGRYGLHCNGLQDVVGDSNVQITMEYYTHTLMTDRADALEKMPDFDAQLKLAKAIG